MAARATAARSRAPRCTASAAVGGEWGGFLSDLVRVPWADHMLVPLPQGLDPAAVASASDNIPDAWRTVGPPLEREPGAAVLIAGGAGSGSIGLYAAAIARALGAERVTYVDADAGRRATAESFGAEALEPGPERLGPFAITVDASGDPAGLQLALSSTAPDGVCTSTAIYFGDPVPMPLFEMYLKIVTFETGRVHARPAIPAVLDLAAGRRLSPAGRHHPCRDMGRRARGASRARLGQAGRPAGGLGLVRSCRASCARRSRSCGRPCATCRTASATSARAAPAPSRPRAARHGAERRRLAPCDARCAVPGSPPGTAGCRRRLWLRSTWRGSSTHLARFHSPA